MVIELINEAKISVDADDKVRLIGSVRETMLKDKTQDKQALLEFVPELLEFKLDTSPVCRKSVVKVIEEVAMFAPNKLGVMVDSLQYLLNDENENVLKAVLLAMVVVYPRAFDVLCWEQGAIGPELTQMWRKVLGTSFSQSRCR